MVVGGVAGVALIAAGAFFLLKRRQTQKNRLSAQGTELEGQGYSKGYSEVTTDLEPRESGDPVTVSELSAAGGVVRAELPSHTTRYELD